MATRADFKDDNGILTRINVALRSGEAWKRLYYFIAAKLLFAIPAKARQWIFAGKQHYCPVCGSHLGRFLVLHRPYHLFCPVCRSLQRQRLLWILLEKQGLIDPRQPQRMLHFAPEACLTRRFTSMPRLEYFSADLQSGRAMLKMDITRIDFPADSFDIILCSHVLEHVADDRKALGELQRVLKSPGLAILLVPLKSGPTHEDASIVDPRERERVFGQFDHVRLYGEDFQERVNQAGFSTTCYSTRDIVRPEDVKTMGLDEKDLIFLARK